MLKKIAKRSDDADAFIRESEPRLGLRDELARRLADEYLRSAANGDEPDEESTEQLLVEELGGPFIESSPEQEFGREEARADPDEEASALPQAVGPLAIASPDEELAAPAMRRGLDDDEDVQETAEPDAEVESRIEPTLHHLDIDHSRER